MEFETIQNFVQEKPGTPQHRIYEAFYRVLPIILQQRESE